MDAVQLATFQVVIEAGSFEAAAQALHLTPSAVSQRIKALEQSVGQVLVRRSKPCTATEAGEALVRLAGQIALLEREALAAARGVPNGGRTRLSVVVNADSLHSWFLPVLAALPTEPALSWELHQDDQDHTADLLRTGTAMAAVTAQRVAVQGCRVERLGAMRYLAVARPGSFVDFAASPMLLFNRKDRLQHRFLAALGRGQDFDPPIHYVPAAHAFVAAIRLGLGWGMVPEQAARADIAAGQVVELAPGKYLDVPLYWQCWRMDSTVLTALTTAVKIAAAQALR